jgi:hypothetical protein
LIAKQLPLMQGLGSLLKGMSQTLFKAWAKVFCGVGIEGLGEGMGLAGWVWRQGQGISMKRVEEDAIETTTKTQQRKQILTRQSEQYKTQKQSKNTV